MQICPNCEYGNREGILFCEECGQPLSGVPATATKQLSTRNLPSALKADTWGTARFGDKSTILIHIRDVAEPLEVQPTEKFVFGRMDTATKTLPDMDLTPFGAQEKGVSRLHAELQRSEESLMLVDLGSVNGTHLNGQRLAPNQPRILRDGDEVRLGKLVMHLYFK